MKKFIYLALLLPAIAVAHIDSDVLRFICVPHLGTPNPQMHLITLTKDGEWTHEYFGNDPHRSRVRVCKIGPPYPNDQMMQTGIGPNIQCELLGPRVTFQMWAGARSFVYSEHYTGDGKSVPRNVQRGACATL